MLLDCFAKDNLGCTIGVNIGCVKRIDAHIVSEVLFDRKILIQETELRYLVVGLYSRSLDMLDGFLFTKDPALPLGRAVRHAPQDDSGNLEARLSKSD